MFKEVLEVIVQAGKSEVKGCRPKTKNPYKIQNQYFIRYKTYITTN
jgi:hypothetical protein